MYRSNPYRIVRFVLCPGFVTSGTYEIMSPNLALEIKLSYSNSNSLKILEDSAGHNLICWMVRRVKRRTQNCVSQVTEQLEEKCLIRRHTLSHEILMLLYYTKQ